MQSYSIRTDVEGKYTVLNSKHEIEEFQTAVAFYYKQTLKEALFYIKEEFFSNKEIYYKDLTLSLAGYYGNQFWAEER